MKHGIWGRSIKNPIKGDNQVKMSKLKNNNTVHAVKNNYFRQDYPLYTRPVNEEFKKFQKYWIVIGPSDNGEQWPAIYFDKRNGTFEQNSGFAFFSDGTIILDKVSAPTNIWKAAVGIRAAIQARAPIGRGKIIKFEIDGVEFDLSVEDDRVFWKRNHTYNHNVLLVGGYSFNFHATLELSKMVYMFKSWPNKDGRPLAGKYVKMTSIAGREVECSSFKNPNGTKLKL